MIGLVSLLLGETLFEGARFIIMLLLLVVGVFVGGKLKDAKDASNAKKLAKEEITSKDK